MAWKKGESGNPGGRPRVIGEIQELAREHTREAIGTLVAIMQDQKASPAARVSASTAILDRAYGKAPQFVASTSLNKPAHELTDAELMEIIASGEN